jgi:hypothetical protein
MDLDVARRIRAAAHRRPYCLESLERLADLCLLAGQFAALIANYNVSHSREAAGKGVGIDLNYLFHLGPQALPAIDRAIALRGYDPGLVSRRGCLVEKQRRDINHWRNWGFRSWRLQRTLDVQQTSSTTG